MSLSKWVSNTPCISNSSDNNNKPAKVLGLHWKHCKHCTSYNACLSTQADSTKRQVLSLVARIFDPLGLIAPVVAQFKILFQDL
ncbi:hypothetical protein ACLKA6_017329 [Drosophila palustris]